MKKISTLLLIALLPLTFFSCKKNLADSKEFGDAYLSSTGGSRGGGGNGGGQNNQPGVITAGEWNDLQNWQFWQDLMDTSAYKKMPAYWSFYNNNRISVIVVSASNQPVVDVPVQLKKNGTTVFSARTDNAGKAELWADIFQRNTAPNLSAYSISIHNGAKTVAEVKSFKDGVNKIEMPAAAASSRAEIAFVVDATGSMGDELEYLKTELLDIIAKSKQATPGLSLGTSALFYRDEGDEYLTRISNFSNEIVTTLNFIKQQSANGGGDFPEAVHTALEKAVNEFQWSSEAKTRLLFLLLDAPPHYKPNIVENLQQTILKASARGIKIIPVVASGIDKETEFLMRMFSITTNGTYVFITNDSGIGNDHLTPTIGQYKVEFLNDLIVRLIKKYTE